MRAWLLYILIVIAALAALLAIAHGFPGASSAVFVVGTPVVVIGAGLGAKFVNGRSVGSDEPGIQCRPPCRPEPRVSVFTPPAAARTSLPRSTRHRALTTPMITKSRIHEVENATVRDRDGASVGKVRQVFPSDEDGSAAFVSVATGLIGGRTALVPVEDATFDGRDLHVGYAKSAIKGAPSPGAGNTLSATEANAVRKHFGLSPTGRATGDMGDPHENLDQAGTGPSGADDTEGAGTTPPA